MTESEIRACIDMRHARELVPAVELTRAFLERIAEAQPAINAFITVAPEAALSDARRVDAARASGRRLPLDGLPMAVKDNIDVAGSRTTVGSKMFEHNFAAVDAHVVRRLREAGAVLLGKANMHELAYGTTSRNQTFGTVRNPWDLARIPGGSSGGSGAALGADLCVGALGSDTGGSVRIPAALNGVSGLRPTYGSVSNRGSYPVSWSFDTIGPMARSVDDVFCLFDAIAGFDASDARAVEPRAARAIHATVGRLDGVRVGLPQTYFFEGLEPDVERSVRAAADVLESLGAELVDAILAGAQDATRTCNLIIRAEALAYYGERLLAAPELIAEDIGSRLRLGADISGVQLAALYEEMYQWRRRVRDLFERVDLVLTPAVDRVAPTIADWDTLRTTAALTRLTYPWSLGALPALAVPCGFNSANLPIGLQLVARPWEEPLLHHAGSAYQNATDWHRRRPSAHEPATFTVTSYARTDAETL